MAITPNWLTRAAAVVLAAGSVGLAASTARAHPHVFIEARTKILYENGKFSGLEHRWTFDEFYTETAIEGLDANKDGVYDREELAELAKVNIEGLKEFAYFTYPTLAGKEVKLADVKDYWLEHTSGALTLVFTLPFTDAVPAAATDFKLAVTDPTFFIGFDWAKGNAVTFSANAPKSCKITLGSGSQAPASPPGQAPGQAPGLTPGQTPGQAPQPSDEQALRGAFAQQFGGGMVMPDRAVTATCPK